MAAVVWLASYPKSGNTWVRALLASYFGDGAFDLDDLGSGNELGGPSSLDALLGADVDALRPDELLAYRARAARQLAADAADRPAPLFCKLHAANVRTADGALTLPPDAGRALYIVRNPLDVAASMAPYFGWTLDRAVEVLGDPAYVLNDRGGRFWPIVPAPLRAWSGHVASWLDAPGLDLHVLRYEDLQADAAGAFAAAVRFAGVEPEAERIAAAVEATRFDRLRQREATAGFKEHSTRATAPFFRSGRAGGWREALTREQARRVVADHGATMRRLGYGDAVDEVAAL